MPTIPLDPITVAEAAELLRVNVSTITRKIRRGELDGAQLHIGLRAPYVVSRFEVLALVAKAAA